jgi:hypothetical protein
MTILTPAALLSFPHLFKPRAPTPGAAERYSCILVFDEKAQATEAFKAMKAAVATCIDEKWGAGKSKDAAFVKGLKHLPFRDAGEKEYEGFDPGKVFISPWRRGDERPGVIDLNGNEILAPGDVFAGQLARASVRAFAFDNSGNRGVSFGLEHVQILKADMPRLDGRKSAAQTFAKAAIEGFDADAYGDPSAASSGDDDFPF